MPRDAHRLEWSRRVPPVRAPGQVFFVLFFSRAQQGHCDWCAPMASELCGCSGSLLMAPSAE